MTVQGPVKKQHPDGMSHGGVPPPPSGASLSGPHANVSESSQRRARCRASSVPLVLSGERAPLPHPPAPPQAGDLRAQGPNHWALLEDVCAPVPACPQRQRARASPVPIGSLARRVNRQSPHSPTRISPSPLVPPTRFTPVFHRFTPVSFPFSTASHCFPQFSTVFHRLGAFSHSAGTARAKRGHSPKYDGVYHGNTPDNHPPTEACMIHSKPRRGCSIQDPGTRGYR